MLSTTPFYITALRSELEKRIHRNPQYSLRSFAAAMEMSPSALSQILASKRSISVKVLNRLLSHLELSESERNQFIDSIVVEKEKSGIQKVNRKLLELGNSRSRTGTRSGEVLQVKEISQDQFHFISEWYYCAIREMTVKKDFRLDARWIAKRLPISPTEAKLAIDRLIEMKLIELKNGRWIKSENSIDTKDKTKTTLAHKKRQKQFLERSLYSLENDPIEIRNHSAVTLVTSEEKIQEAKKRIHDFIWDLTAFMEAGPQEKVYEISVQLFPLERGGK